jgi:hypothetical protein
MDNKLQDNGKEYYKFATITVRVFVDKDEVENAAGDSFDTEEAFDKLAKKKITELFPTETPVKHYETDLA